MYRKIFQSIMDSSIASDTLSKDPKKKTKKIDQAAQKLFEKYPSTSGG